MKWGQGRILQTPEGAVSREQRGKMVLEHGLLAQGGGLREDLWAAPLLGADQ